MMLIDCPKCGRDCGKEVSSGSVVCPLCYTSLRREDVGTPVQVFQQEMPYTQKQSVDSVRITRTFLITALIAVVGVFVSVFVLMFSLNVVTQTPFTIDIDSVQKATSFPNEADWVDDGSSEQSIREWEYGDYFDIVLFVRMVWDEDFICEQRSYEFWDETTDMLMECRGDYSGFVDATGGVVAWQELYALYTSQVQVNAE